MEITKQDWNLFRNKIAAWQEVYMEQLNQEYMDILSGQGNPSEKFWLLEKRINQDKRCRGVAIQMRKQNLPYDLASLINDGVITFSDIQEFSDELKDAVKHLCNIRY